MVNMIKNNPLFVLTPGLTCLRAEEVRLETQALLS